MHNMFINIMHIICTTGYRGAPIENDSHLQLGRLAGSAETPPHGAVGGGGRVYIQNHIHEAPPPGPLAKKPNMP